MEKSTMRSGVAETVEAYIALQPESIREKLEELRQIIRSCVPDAAECISYGMPAYRQGKVLVYFAAASKHLGFYPTTSGISHFQDSYRELGLRFSKGAVQFPYDKPLPGKLIREIVLYRQQEELTRKK